MPRTNVIKGVLGLSVAALFAAGASQAQTTPTQQPDATGVTASGADKAMSTLSMADQKVLKGMAQENMMEVEVAHTAQSKSQNDDVKKFAQQMIDDHNKVLDDIKQLAQSKGVSLPTDLDRSHKAKADKLASLSGDAFDRAFLSRAGLADHKHDRSMLKKSEARVKDPDLKALLTRTMPVIEQHLSAAEQLQKNTARGSSKTQGSTGTSPDKKY